MPPKGKGRKHNPDFWREWRHHRHGHRGGPPPEVVEQWRKYFREHMGDFPEKHWAFGGRRFNPWHNGVDTFNPFVASLLSKGGGLLPLLVLHLIGQKPRYGNEVMNEIAERTDEAWVPNPGAIYPLMTQLEEEGFIEGAWEDPDKRTVRIYHLTEKGQLELERMRSLIGPKLREATEVMVRFGELLKGSSSDDSQLV